MTMSVRMSSFGYILHLLWNLKCRLHGIKLEFTTPTPTQTSSRGSSPTRQTRAISWSYFCGKLNDTPTFSRRFSRGCRRGCRCRYRRPSRRRGMPALGRVKRWRCISWRRESISWCDTMPLMLVISSIDLSIAWLISSIMTDEVSGSLVTQPTEYSDTLAVWSETFIFSSFLACLAFIPVDKSPTRPPLH